MPDLPTALSAQYASGTGQLTVTFSETIAAVNLPANRFRLDDVGAQPRGNDTSNAGAGTVLSWPTSPFFDATNPPPRLAYTAGAGGLATPDGRALQSFTGLPLTVV